MGQFLPAPDNGSPANAAVGRSAATQIYSTATSPIVQMHPNFVAVAGGSQPHNNMMPYLTLNFCICLQGVFPARP